MLIIFFFQIFKEFENLSVEKRRFRLRWDSSPGLSIAGRFQTHLINLKFFFLLNFLSTSKIDNTCDQSEKMFGSDHIHK